MDLTDIKYSYNVRIEPYMNDYYQAVLIINTGYEDVETYTVIRSNRY